MVKKNKKSLNHKMSQPRAKGHASRNLVHNIAFAMSLAIISLGTIITGTMWFYGGRVLPNVSVAKIAIGQKTEADVRRIIDAQQAVLQVTFVDERQARTVSAQDLGVTIDTDATLQQVMQARKQGNLLQNIALWQTQSIPLVLTTEPGKLIEFIKQHYPTLFVDPKDAQLVYNMVAQRFDIQPGAPGKGFDIKWFQSQLTDLAEHPRSIKLSLTTAPVEPIITDKSLLEPQQQINRQLRSQFSFTRDGQTKYTATPDDIANWVHFVPDAVKGTATIDYDKAKIEQFLAQQVTPTVAQTAIDRKVIVDKETGAQTVVVPGRAGQQIQDAGRIADELITALSNNQSLTKELHIVTAPFKTITLTGSGKWIEVDLSEQRLTLYVDEARVNSFLISSGTAKTPTPPGVFKVWSKTPSQTMTGTIAGDYFRLPNVKWVSYVNGDVAIHGTYWHRNFGRPMSHGCINMTEAAAKIVYDFAPLGTRVVVHQ